LKKNEKFTELRSLNFIPEKLSKHWKHTRFGGIHKLGSVNKYMNK
jgi:hypothetical protein